MSEKGFFNTIYQVYAKDLGREELDRLIKTEAPEVYNFYLGKITDEHLSRNKFSRFLLICRAFIKAFLMKLSPVKRIAYSASVLFFLLAWVSNNWLYALFAFFIINLLLIFELAAKLTLTSELDQAQKIQMDALPKQAPAIAGIDIAFFTKTAREVGGDYVEFFNLNGTDKNLLVVGDISGKGMGAALYMLQVRAVLTYLTFRFSDLKQIMFELNGTINKLFDVRNFFTAIFASIDCEKNIEICRAGHCPAVLYRAESKSIEIIKPAGIGCGLRKNELFEKILVSDTFHLNTGDLLMLYTDGLTETMNFNNEEFGEVRLNQIINKAAHKTSQQIIDEILFYNSYFRDSAPIHDDITIVVIKATEK